ncbi:MAG: tRNA uridine-5-carboxymethylaminomethyl(34) synthesis GTPase MnmE [Rhodospirillales bacterium]|nr:MAG: tRNA uridine-5-carboxymethylaminomethyl(34) synthesis GTPase MnmE [Rhodospirillales bacterium]
MERDTIFAPATGQGRAGIAVIRISGTRAVACLERLTGRDKLVPRQASVVAIRDGQGELLDRGLAIWFPGPASFTGEDVVELHLHGGRAVVTGVMGALAALPGVRVAEAGEFSRRAFEQGKLDLTAAEGLADLVAAETPEQRRQALRQLDGGLAAIYERWRGELIRGLADLEAVIDFAEEELPEGLVGRAQALASALAGEIGAHLADGGRGERLREGIRIAILGAPNAGKSSLLNVLAGRDAAIVAASPGTTRDVVEVRLELAGCPVTLMDTAGIRETREPVEQEGVRRSQAAAADADIRLVVFDGENWPGVDEPTAALRQGASLGVLSKSDRLAGTGPWSVGGQGVLAVSVVSGAGLPELKRHLSAMVRDRYGVGDGVVLTRARHRAALEECREALRRAAEGGVEELVVEDVRMAARALGRLTGRVDVEDVLDLVFRDFCIGK